jgi:hypothetical protein
VCTANLDFNKMRAEGFQRTHLLPLAAGFPGTWSRPGLLDAYRSGIQEGVLFPGLHGTTHFCSQAFSNALAGGGERAAMLRLLWEADTPYIYWRMPWIGYEYWNPEKPHAGFLPAVRQRNLITEASSNFFEVFGARPTTACAPGYRSNSDTCRAWGAVGIQVAVHGTGDGLRSPEIDDGQILHVYRTIDFEPSQRSLEVDKYLEIAAACFARGLPVIISVHSINFHSTIKDFRSSTLSALDRILSELESRYPSLLYVNDQDLHRIVTAGVLDSAAGTVKVSARRQNPKARAAEAGAL